MILTSHEQYFEPVLAACSMQVNAARDTLSGCFSGLGFVSTGARPRCRMRNAFICSFHLGAKYKNSCDGTEKIKNGTVHIYCSQACQELEILKTRTSRSRSSNPTCLTCFILGSLNESDFDEFYNCLLYAVK